jgi:C4-dicarboxylate transporter DctM subunit
MNRLFAQLDDWAAIRRRLGWAIMLCGVAALFLWGTDSLAGPAIDLELEDVHAREGSGAGVAKILFVLALMIALGMPLFVMIGVLATLCYYWLGFDFSGLDSLDTFPAESADMMGKNVLLAIPFFVTSGAIMSEGGIAPRLVNFAQALVGWLPGGLAIATVGSCVFFAAISGSSPVTVIAIGSMMYPRLLKAGYDKNFSLGLVSSAGSLGILIPPSIPMLVYAIVASDQRPIEASELFMAGVLPGVLIGVLMSVYSMIRSGKQPREKFEFAIVIARFKDGFWAISLPVFILGGIYTGVFTATEAAAASVVYALVIELFIHRDVQARDLGKILGESAITMGAILIIMLMAVTLNKFLVEEKIPDQIVASILDMELTPVSFLLIVNFFLLGVGALMDSISAILIIAPLLVPIAIQLGIDPVHLGVVFIVNLEIGYLTPPIGINLFVASLAFKESMGEVIKGVLPFIALMFIGLGAVTYVPSVALGPVNVFMRDKPFYEPFPEAPERKTVLAEEAFDDEDDEEAGTPAAAEGGKVLSMEEMMKQAEGGEDEGGDEDTADGGKVLSMEELMQQAGEDEGAEADEDEDEDEGPAEPGKVLSMEELMQQAEKD